MPRAGACTGLKNAARGPTDQPLRPGREDRLWPPRARAEEGCDAGNPHGSYKVPPSRHDSGLPPALVCRPGAGDAVPCWSRASKQIGSAARGRIGALSSGVRYPVRTDPSDPRRPSGALAPESLWISLAEPPGMRRSAARGRARLLLELYRLFPKSIGGADRSTQEAPALPGSRVEFIGSGVHAAGLGPGIESLPSVGKGTAGPAAKPR
jgi:hypothetical protein